MHTAVIITGLKGKKCEICKWTNICTGRVNVVALFMCRVNKVMLLLEVLICSDSIQLQLYFC